MQTNSKVNGNKINNKNVVSLNLSAFAQKLQSINVKEKSVKETIYVYPENFTPRMISEIDGTKHRNKLRNQLTRHCNNIFVYAKTNNAESLTTEIKAFKTFYKENYRVNDYSLNSLTQGKNEFKIEDVKLMLEIIKSVEAQTTKKTEKSVSKDVTPKKEKSVKNVKETPKETLLNVAVK